jgi:hypothetical protein
MAVDGCRRFIGAGTEWADVAAVILGLGVDFGVASHLAGGGLRDLGADPLSQAERVGGADDAGLGRLD